MRWVGALVLAGCRVNFDPSTFDTCDITNELGVPSFRWAENDHCYSLHSTAVSHDAARDACASIDFHRVTIGSADELAAVREALAPSVPVWLGGFDDGSGEGFKWATGEAPLYGNWAPGQPVSGGGAVMDTNGLWSMQSGAVHPYICERSVVVTSNRVYTLVTPGRQWAEARDRCDLVGAHLATITSTLESVTVGPLIATERWIGASAAAGTLDFKWITGEPFEHDEWENSQPDGTDELCVEADDRGWNNDSCDKTLASICEYE